MATIPKNLKSGGKMASAPGALGALGAPGAKKQPMQKRARKSRNQKRNLGNAGITIIIILYLLFISYYLLCANFYACLLYLLSSCAILYACFFLAFISVIYCRGFVHFQKKALQQSVTIKKAFNYKGLSQKMACLFLKIHFGHYISATWLQFDYNNVYIKYIDL